MVKPFNFEHAVFGGLRTGVYVGLANATTGFLPALLSAVRQVPISFVMIGVNVYLFEVLSSRSRVVSIVLPSGLTSLVSYGIHSYLGTPNLFLTVLTVFAVACVSFIALTIVQETCGTISLLVLLKKLRKRLQNPQYG